MVNYARTPEGQRNYQLKKWYGITLKQYNVLLEAQNNVCKICKRPPSKKMLHVDHDHRTGRIRGLLCHKCNVGLGHFNDDITLLKRAVDYLET